MWPSQRGDVARLRAPSVRRGRRSPRCSACGRDEAGLFLAEGPQAVREALAEPPGPSSREVFAPRGAAAVTRASSTRRDAPAYRVSPAEDAVPSRRCRETVDARRAWSRSAARSTVHARRTRSARGRRWSPSCATVRDPGNAGTVIRCADAAGADAVVLAADSVDPYNGKCVRASRRQPVPPPGRHRRRPRCDAVAALRRSRAHVLAADGAGDTTSTAPSTRRCSLDRPRGCSATRPGGCPRRSGDRPTTSSGSRSTAGPRA